MQKLSAPVRPLSDQLKINPSDVRPPSKDEVKPQQDSGKVKPLDAKVTPLEAPVRPLPSTVAPINPGTVKAPSASTPSPADHVNLTAEVPHKPAVNLGKTAVPRLPKAVPQRNVRTLDVQDRAVQALSIKVTPINQPDSAGEATNLDFRVRYNQQSQLTQYSNYTAFDKQADDAANRTLNSANAWGGTGASQYSSQVQTGLKNFGVSSPVQQSYSRALEPETPMFGVNASNYYRSYSEAVQTGSFANARYESDPYQEIRFGVNANRVAQQAALEDAWIAEDLYRAERAGLIEINYLAARKSEAISDSVAPAPPAYTKKSWGWGVATGYTGFVDGLTRNGPLGSVNLRNMFGVDSSALYGDPSYEKAFSIGSGIIDSPFIGAFAGTKGKGNLPSKSTHFNQRVQEGKQGDASRSLGDWQVIVNQGRQYKQASDGRQVFVKGDKVVILEADGKTLVTQFRNPSSNTQQRVRDGRWLPVVR